MCLAGRSSKEEKKQWLEDQPEIITAYKVVKIVEGKKPKLRAMHFFGSFVKIVYIKRRNRLLWKWEKVNSMTGSYVPYYHLYMSKDDIPDFHCFEGDPTYEVIECNVPKRLVTAIGEEYGEFGCLVAKGYDVVGQDKYLD